MDLPKLDDLRIAVIGLGYVGLPVAVEFGKHHPVVGFDIDKTRLAQLRDGFDRTLEVAGEDLSGAKNLTLSSDPSEIADCNVYIVTVPTPIDSQKRPDMRQLRAASRLVGAALGPGDVVIFESTVYPGATEDVCVPILTGESGLTLNRDYFVGYSPERINPGDKAHRLTTIQKITSGSTPEAAEFIDGLYGSIITAGTYRAPSIRVAEAAKVIENTQRDVNIALINELAMIFDLLDINTHDVLAAAGTKWNFLPFRPGLVGGHCIGVDPYYLTHKAQEMGYDPEVVLAGRRINDGMGAHLANRLIRAMIHKDIPVKGGRALIMGLTFKENCPDMRNTRVVDIIETLRDFGMQVDVHDPWVDPVEASDQFGIEICDPEPGVYDAIVLAVGHDLFRDMARDALKALGRPAHVFMDVKGLRPDIQADVRL